MRPISKKRSRRNADVKPARDSYRDECSICQWCHSCPAAELHEIARGASRDAALSERAAWLHLCRPCHAWIAFIPVQGQLAIKWISDPVGYDRVTVNRLRGRADNAITEREVDEWVRRFRL